ncbi:MAG: Tol-Pal system beta propeller repeat protein TolB [Beijerinckiaceae bacterium]
MTDPVSRRQAMMMMGSASLFPAIAGEAFAQGRTLDIRGGSFQPAPIAVTPLAGDPAQGPALSRIINNNFKRSVYLTPVDPATFPERIENPDAMPRMDAWRTINAQYVVTGRTGRAGDGRLRSEFRLWDIARGQQIAGQQYVTDPKNSRRVAHIISDAIFTRITGEKGFFDTRVVFVDERGPKQKRQKRLAMMDQDGANMRYLTGPNELVVTPRFSPNSQDVTYMSYGRGDPKVYLLNLENGQREVVGNFPGMTFSPRFSPDGQRVIMSLSTGATTNLFAMDLRSRSTTRLTDTQGIDTSPSYSPDGGQIVFESDRGGSQQLYIMGAGGGGARRISFGAGARYSTPVWSPKGDYIAFTRQKAGQFAIGVMKPDGSGERIITEGYHNEGPTWAPNGLYVMFFRDPGGASGPRIYMANITGRGEFRIPTPAYASDPSWSPLLR